LRMRVSMSEIGSVMSALSKNQYLVPRSARRTGEPRLYQELFVTPVTSPSSASFRKQRRHMSNFRM